MPGRQNGNDGVALAKLTSKKIAELAGVSVSTVSIVLNNKNGVSQETRARILSLLSENGITPKASARKQAEKHGTIRFFRLRKHGNIVNERHNDFLADYICGIVDEAKVHGYVVEVTTSDLNSFDSLFSDLSRNSNISGCIILSTELDLEDVMRFSTLPIPHVFLDACFDEVEENFVTMDNVGMIRSALSRLIGLGHERITMFSATSCKNFDDRHEAYLKTMEEHSFKSEVVNVHSTLNAAYEDTLMFLSGKDKSQLPTAIITSNDVIAFGAVKALLNRGYSIPGDVSVVGFDDLPMSSLLEPQLSSLSVPKVAMGRAAVDLLVSRMEGKNPQVGEKRYMYGPLVERQSISVPREP